MNKEKNNNRRKKAVDKMAAGDFRRKEEVVEKKDYSFAACRESELEENAFSRFYRQKRDDVNLLSIALGLLKSRTNIDDSVERFPAHFEMDVYKHKDAIDFAAKTWEWRDSFKEKMERKRLERCKDPELLHANCLYSFGEESIRAYYRVVSEQEDKYILMACHVNLHGFHRGDLRFIEVNDRTVTKDFDFSVIGKLFLGDIVAVTKLCKAGKEPLEPLNKAHKVNQDSKIVWEVAEMRVLARHLKENVVFAFMRNGCAIAKGYNEAMTVKFDSTMAINFNSLYIAKACIPVKLQSKFIDGYSKATMRVQLLEMCSKFSTCPDALGTIYEYEFSESLTEQFEIGVDAFKRNHEHTPEEITELCAQMGQSAVLTLFDGRSDSRGFPMQDASKYENIIRFSIPNPLKHPTEGLWNCNNRIMMEGFNRTFDGTVKYKATIENVLPLEKDRLLQISARVSRESFDRIKLGSGTFVVYQREPKAAVFLPNHFLRKHDSTANGIQIIRTLYGGSSLQTTAIDSGKEECPKYTFPSEPPVPLNDYQNEYIRMITSRDYPMVLGSSPFGCGKSMTIVMAAIEICKKHKISQQFLVTQSNYASVNLIDIARKVNDPDMRIVRYVSAENRKELPEQCQTEFDLPVLKDLFFRKLAYGEISHGRDFKINNVDLILAYLFRSEQALHYEELCSLFRNRYISEIDNIREIPVKRRSRELFAIFMEHYKPNLIVITADTLQSVMSASKAFSNVITIQIDEACQLPECTLISLLLLFLEANYGLIGDIKQLPPYCEDDLTGKLKEYGIGNTMERAIEEKMFPEAILRYVYRCHPKITELLSELFYEGKLISGVKEEHRNEFKRKRPDIWPNKNYPIICVDNKDKGNRIGTSCGNKSEVILVKQIVKCLLEKKNDYQLKQSDIGVISFYAAQTGILTDLFRGTEVKCGTVDAFQGSEREVIILCCTNERISEFMQLSNRLNVAMSRARQATIIIGNLKGLSEAAYWKTILRKVDENKCVVDTKKYPFRVSPEELINEREEKRSEKQHQKTRFLEKTEETSIFDSEMPAHRSRTYNVQISENLRGKNRRSDTKTAKSSASNPDEFQSPKTFLMKADEFPPL